MSLINNGLRYKMFVWNIMDFKSERKIVGFCVRASVDCISPLNWGHGGRADFRFAFNQWETALLCNDVSHWLGASLESAHGSPMPSLWKSCRRWVRFIISMLSQGLVTTTCAVKISRFHPGKYTFIFLRSTSALYELNVKQTKKIENTDSTVLREIKFVKHCDII